MIYNHDNDSVHAFRKATLESSSPRLNEIFSSFIDFFFLTNQVFVCVFPFVHVDVCRLRFHSSNLIPSRTNKHSKKFLVWSGESHTLSP